MSFPDLCVPDIDFFLKRCIASPRMGEYYILLSCCRNSREKSVHGSQFAYSTQTSSTMQSTNSEEPSFSFFHQALSPLLTLKKHVYPHRRGRTAAVGLICGGCPPGCEACASVPVQTYTQARYRSLRTRNWQPGFSDARRDQSICTDIESKSAPCPRIRQASEIHLFGCENKPTTSVVSDESPTRPSLAARSGRGGEV